MNPPTLTADPMPLERSDAILDLSDPNIVVGPRKHRPTKRLLENGDPQVCKKMRLDHLSTSMTVSTASADKGDLTLPLMPPLTHPTHPAPGPRPATDCTEGSDDKHSDGAQAIVVEDSDKEESDEGSDEGTTTEEDDDAELGACSINLVNF